METYNHVVFWLRAHSILAMIVAFGLIVIATYWPGRRASLERDGMIPLNDDR